MSGNSTGKRARRKVAPKRKYFVPPKPYKTFPLTPHSSGMWMKKVRGQIYYFGRWGRRVDGEMQRLPNDGWEDAKKLWDAQKNDLYAGKVPATRTTEKPSTTDWTVFDLHGQFLEAMTGRFDEKDLKHRSYWTLRATADQVLDTLGATTLLNSLTMADFQKLRKRISTREPRKKSKNAKKTELGPTSPVTIGNQITRIKTIFNFAVRTKLIDKFPDCGIALDAPSKNRQKEHKESRPKKLFIADEIRAMLTVASPTIKAATMLAINTGCGNTDIALIEPRHLDLDKAWLDYPRRKNSNPRRVPLWPETVVAINEAVAAQPKPKTASDAELLLLNNHGECLIRLQANSRCDDIGREFGRLMEKAGIERREGVGFYSLRHTMATIGLQAKDRDAVKAVMGHKNGDILEGYDETGPSDERKLAVVNTVRDWLFSKEGGVK